MATHNFNLALKVSGDKVSSIARVTFCENSIEQNAIGSTAKCTDRGFSEPNK